jgi:type III pantothenate kinase
VLLCIDIGNTNTVLATFDGDKLVHSWRIKTDARSTADELGLMFRGLLAGDAVEITGVAACSTEPAALRSLRTMLGRYTPTCERDRRARGAPVFSWRSTTRRRSAPTGW